MVNRLLLLFLFLFILSNSTIAQSINDLKNQKEKINKEITYINNLLKETSRSTRSSMEKVKILERKLKLQSRMIDQINREISLLDSSIVNGSRTYDSLATDLQTIRERYAQMIRYAQRIQKSENQLLFYFSADDFNQAYKRYTYLRQYGDYRRKQAEIIQQKQQQLDSLLHDLSEKKGEKGKLLDSRVEQARVYETQKKEQAVQLSEFKNKEKDLKRKLESQKETAARLEREIEKIIASEALKSKERGAKAPDKATVTKNAALSSDFSKNKGILPWPVQQGTITDHFGEHPHVVLKHVMTRNAGIDITTSSGARVKAVFKGEVSKVISIPGGNLAIIIRHGSYLSVYSNLLSVNVKAGENVSTGQEIGVLFTEDGENKSVLKFQIWYENSKQDPELWLSN